MTFIRFICIDLSIVLGTFNLLTPLHKHWNFPMHFTRSLLKSDFNEFFWNLHISNSTMLSALLWIDGFYNNWRINAFKIWPQNWLHLTKSRNALCFEWTIFAINAKIGEKGQIGWPQPILWKWQFVQQNWLLVHWYLCIHT